MERTHINSMQRENNDDKILELKDKNTHHSCTQGKHNQHNAYLYHNSKLTLPLSPELDLTKIPLHKDNHS